MSTENIVGIGSAISWLVMLNYLKYNPNINMVTTSIMEASRSLLTFFIGTIPFFMAFVVVSYILFYKLDKFSSFTQCVTVLFSLSNADSINVIFELISTEGLLG